MKKHFTVIKVGKNIDQMINEFTSTLYGKIP